MFKLYNGKIHNHDSKRPAMGSICKIASIKGTTLNESKANYELINILVNGGKYDSYVCKNVKTGKIKNAGMITINNDALITEKVKDAICSNHTGKMKDVLSISTSVLENKNCIERSKDVNSICHYCFAQRMLAQYESLEKKLSRNTELLTKQVIPAKLMPVLNCAIFRFESFGDLNNETQVLNYFNLCEKNKNTSFALWTKNPWFIKSAMNHYNRKKPKNLIVIYSSPRLNEICENMPELYIDENTGKSIIDKVFTVFDKDHAKDVTINCGARSCNSCRRCYSRKSGKFVNELLK